MTYRKHSTSQMQLSDYVLADLLQPGDMIVSGRGIRILVSKVALPGERKFALHWLNEFKTWETTCRWDALFLRIK
jgi:hypothetical protein